MVQRSRLVRVLVAIGLVALAAIGLRLSEGDEDAAEIVRGRVGEPVAVNDGTVNARDVRVGTALSRNDEVYATTPGLFVVIRVEVAATGREEVATYDGRLLVDGRRYDALSGSSTGTVPPGFARESDLVFEVDPARLADLTLELRATEVVTAYPQWARIHLGITDDNAEAWRAAGRDQTLVTADRTSRGI